MRVSTGAQRTPSTERGAPAAPAHSTRRVPVRLRSSKPTCGDIVGRLLVLVAWIHSGVGRCLQKLFYSTVCVDSDIALQYCTIYFFWVL